MSTHRLTWAIVALTLWIPAAPAAAQATRDEAVAAAQAAKASDLRPYELSPLERRLERVGRFINATPTVYTFFGSVYPGGLLAVGPGVRRRFGDTGSADVHAAWSLKNFKLVDGTVWLPEMADRRIRIGGRATWIDAPSVAFYGVGFNSAPEDRTTFAYRSATGGLSGRVRAMRFGAVGGGVDVLDLDANLNDRAENPQYTRSHVFAEIDSRQSPGYTTRGGLYRVEWSNYDERTSAPGSFTRLDAEVDQFVPIFRENRVLAFRAFASLTDTDPGESVPYFLLPDLGGSRLLRGYSTFRFRDRNRIALTGEYRWTAGRFVDMALFVDAGKVTADRGDLNLRGLRTGYGIGVRFHTPAATALRVELARSVEGLGLVFAFGPSF
jgi:hypothetical protein